MEDTGTDTIYQGNINRGGEGIRCEIISLKAIQIEERRRMEKRREEKYILDHHH